MYAYDLYYLSMLIAILNEAQERMSVNGQQINNWIYAANTLTYRAARLQFYVKDVN